MSTLGSLKVSLFTRYKGKEGNISEVERNQEIEKTVLKKTIIMRVYFR